MAEHNWKVRPYKLKQERVPEHIERNYDYLKYWKIVRYWALRKYKITNTDLDFLLFLYSEGLFNKAKFDLYDNMMR